MNGLRDTLHRRAICHSIGRIVSEEFANASLITLHCSSTVVMPPDLAKRVFKTWAYKIQLCFAFSLRSGQDIPIQELPCLFIPAYCVTAFPAAIVTLTETSFASGSALSWHYTPSPLYGQLVPIDLIIDPVYQPVLRDDDPATDKHCRKVLAMRQPVGAGTGDIQGQGHLRDRQHGGKVI